MKKTTTEDTKSTTYYLTPNKSKNGLVFSEYEYLSEKLTISTQNIENNNDVNHLNFGLIRIGFNGQYASLNHKTSKNFMSLIDSKNRSSLFRILFIDSVDKFMLLYKKNPTKLKSYINPRKKIANINNNLVSRNLSDQHKHHNFKINPIEGMTSMSQPTNQSRNM